MKHLLAIIALALIIGLFIFSCQKKNASIIKDDNEKKEFITSFETINDFSGFYLTPQGYKGTTFHGLLYLIEYKNNRYWLL